MDILKSVGAELLGMFIADIRLTSFTLLLIAAVAILIAVLQTPPLLGGGILLVGCIAILIEAALRESRLRLKDTDLV